MNTTRIPEEILEDLRDIRIELEIKHAKAAPTIQDLVSVALKRLLRDWEGDKEELLKELLESREQSRNRMGNSR